MNINFILKIIIFIYSYYLTNRSRLNVVACSNENTKMCNVTLNLSNTGLKYLTANFININCVRNLILRNNNIEDLEADIFDTQPHLEHLDLSRNSLKLHKLLSYGGRLTLKVLILDHNNQYSDNISKADTIENDLENRGNNSHKTEISKNELIITGIFFEVQHLSLRNLKIDTLPDDFFIYFPKLTHLDLSENKFSTKTLHFLLQSMSSTVMNLILENVGLTSLRSESLEAVRNLNLNHNYFRSLRSHMCYGDSTICFESYHNLKFLSISNCYIVTVEENAFQYMKNLSELDISNNDISTISNRTFSYLPSLTSLNLSKNSLIYMPNIGYLQNLTSLKLSEMKRNEMIRSLQTFTYLRNLKYISIGKNKLTTIPSTLFKNLPALEIVDLSNNQLTFLPSWETQKSIRQLYLNSNKIKNVNDISIREALSLELLVLTNNSISKINITSLKNLPNSSVMLYL